jgi:spheroidene monooxygenase
MLRRTIEPAVPLPNDEPQRGTAANTATMPPTVALLLLVKFAPAAVPWGLSRLVRGERALGKVPGLRFARVLGSGRGGGFGLAPGLDHQGLMCFFDGEDTAREFAAAAPAVSAYREHASELLLALLRATSCRGHWGGETMGVSATARDGAPMAALTRASIRPRHAARFWRHAPATHEGIARAPGCRLAVGLGEAPLLRQATFSLWDNAQAMDAYARSGVHLEASQSAYREGWFSESMFVRFAPLSIEGRWQGRRHG